MALIEQLRRRRAHNLHALAETAPERLGDFRIIREVGRGGMGIVYEAEQESLRRRVALKVLPRLSQMDASRVERFRREALAASMLHHNHIVPVFGVGEIEGSHFYVMPFIDGKGMDEILAGWRRQSGGKAPVADVACEEPRWRLVARLGAQVADALQFAHEHGVLHRDIKPANLLLDERGKIWVTDFGLAKLLESGDLTRTGDLIGTLQYMPPESLGGRGDARGDIYSLGLTLREMLTLEPPYPETDPSSLLKCVAEGRPTAPRKIDPSLPRDLETIILKATAHDPADRYETARELSEDLGRLLADRAIQGGATGARTVLAVVPAQSCVGALNGGAGALSHGGGCARLGELREHQAGSHGRVSASRRGGGGKAACGSERGTVDAGRRRHLQYAVAPRSLAAAAPRGESGVREVAGGTTARGAALAPRARRRSARARRARRRE